MAFKVNDYVKCVNNGGCPPRIGLSVGRTYRVNKTIDDGDFLYLDGVKGNKRADRFVYAFFAIEAEMTEVD